MAGYDPNVLSTILSVGRRVGASKKEMLAAVETGIVESGLRNLPGGDADSAGWRQERASLYPNPTNVRASAERFFREAKGFNRPGISAGELAARTQRPAAQYRGRYQGVRSQAAALLNKHGGGVLGGGGAAGSTTTTVTQSGSQGTLDQGQAATLLPLLESLTGHESGPRSTAGVAAPSFSAAPAMPAGYQAVPSGGGPAPAPDIGKLADAIKTIGGQVPQAALQGQDTTAVSSSTSGGAGGRVLTGGGYPLGRKGKVIGVPHAGTHTLGNWQSDNALDIATPVGTPMVAAEDAVVVKVKHHPQDGGRFAGDQITLRGKDGNGFFYAHGVTAKGLAPGMKVKAGQVIGRSGSANGVAHLHIGIERGDPRKLFG